MKKVKKIVALLLALTLAMGMMAGCGKKETSATPAPATDAPATEAPAPDAEAPDAEAPVVAEDQACTLRVNTQMAGTDTAAPVFQAVLKQWAVDHPTIKIEDESQVVDESTKANMVTDFTMDNEPDVMQFFCDATVTPILEMGKVVSLEEMQAYNSEIGKDLTASAISASQSPFDGKNYCVPTTGMTEGLFVNTKLFEQFSLELPDTWDKFIKAVETFAKNDIIPIAISLNKEPHYLAEHLMLGAAGKDIYTSTPEQAPVEFGEGLAYFKQLRDMGAFPKDTDSIDNATAQELFRNGQAAMSIDGSWAAGGVPEEIMPDIKFMAFPVVPNGKNTDNTYIAGFTSGFFISKKAWDDPVKKDAAVKFVLANTNKEMTIKYWQALGAAKCAVEVTDADKTELNSLAKQMLEYGPDFPAVTPTDARIAGEAWNSAIINNIPAISKGEMDPQKATAELFKLYWDSKKK